MPDRLAARTALRAAAEPDRSATRVGHIDRRTQEGFSRLHAILYACHHRLVNGYKVRDHIWFASANPERVAAIAAQMGIPPQSATACMIVEQIDEEFHFTPKA